MDEAYIRVKGEWRYLYRAVDKGGNTIDFLPCAHRDKTALGITLRNRSPRTRARDGDRRQKRCQSRRTRSHQ